MMGFFQFESIKNPSVMQINNQQTDLQVYNKHQLQFYIQNNQLAE